jgi:hypothetical protein
MTQISQRSVYELTEPTPRLEAVQTLYNYRCTRFEPWSPVLGTDQVQRIYQELKEGPMEASGPNS